MALGIKLFKGTKSDFEDLQIKIDEFFITMNHIKVISIQQTQSFDQKILLYKSIYLKC